MLIRGTLIGLLTLTVLWPASASPSAPGGAGRASSETGAVTLMPMDPGGPAGALSAIDPAVSRLYCIGGLRQTGPREYVYTDEVRCFDIARWEWITGVAEPFPSPRVRGGCAIDPVRRRLVVYGGRGPQGTCVDGLYELNLGDAKWHALPAMGATPGPRENLGLAIDPVTGSPWVLFGNCDRLAPYTSYCSYIHDAARWDIRRVNGVDEVPPRSNFTAATDTRRGRLIVYGGLRSILARAPRSGVSEEQPLPEESIASGEDPLGEVWWFEPEAGQWTLAEPVGPAPATRWDAVVSYDAVSDLLLVAGGLFFAPPRNIAATDVWGFSFRNRRWHRIADWRELGAGRYGAAGGYDPCTGMLLVSGGTDSTRFRVLPDGIGVQIERQGQFAWRAGGKAPTGSNAAVWGELVWQVAGPNEQPIEDVALMDCARGVVLQSAERIRMAGPGRAEVRFRALSEEERAGATRGVLRVVATTSQSPIAIVAPVMKSEAEGQRAVAGVPISGDANGRTIEGDFAVFGYGRSAAIQYLGSGELKCQMKLLDLAGRLRGSGDVVFKPGEQHRIFDVVALREIESASVCFLIVRSTRGVWTGRVLLMPQSDR